MRPRLLGVCFLLGFPCTAKGFDIQQIQHEIETRHAAIRDLYAEYTIRAVSEDQTQDYSRHVFAAKGNSYFTENVHANRGVPEKFDLNHHQAWLTERGLDLFYPTTRYFERTQIRAGSESNLKLRASVITEILAWWPPEDEVPVDNLVVLPMKSVFRAKEFTIATTADLVAETPCVRISSHDQETMWLDPARGFTLIRRVVAASDAISDYRFSKFKKIEKDTYFPTQCQCVTFSNDDDKAVLGDFHYDISTLIANSLTADFFQFDPPAGTLMEFIDEQRMTQIPGGREVLDHVVDATLVNLTATGREVAQPGRDIRPVVLIVSVFVLVVLGVVLVLATRNYMVRGVSCLLDPANLGECHESLIDRP